jgi:uncharacterized membrane protein (DUF2068 family)
MTAPSQAVHSTQRTGEAMLRLIGAFKLAKSLFLIAAALATLRLIHSDINEVVLDWAHRLHLAPGNQLVQRALEISPQQLRVLAMVLGMYAVMFLIEGTGLILRQHWAEWMTVVTTAGLIPLEIYEIVRRVTALKIGTFILNIAIVGYLILLLYRQHKQKQITPS